MYQIPPHHTPATIGQLAAVVVAALLLLVLATSLPVAHPGGGPAPQPQYAPPGLDL